MDSLQRIEGLGKQLFDTLVSERIIMRNKPLTDTIVKNKIDILVFGFASKLSNNKKNNHIATLKFDCSLFARMYISYQAGKGDLGQFFKHENQCSPITHKHG